MLVISKLYVLTYRKLNHERIYNAPKNSDEVKSVPRILKVALKIVKVKKENIVRLQHANIGTKRGLRIELHTNKVIKGDKDKILIQLIIFTY